MSSDNYYLIRKDRQGYFAVVMGFASLTEPPAVRANSARFEELFAAMDYAAADYSEYGVIIHEECYSDKPILLVRNKETGHYPTCPTTTVNGEQWFDCICGAIEDEWLQDYSDVVQ